MFFITHRATNSFTGNYVHAYPAAVPLVICTAKPVTIAEAAEVLSPLFLTLIVAVPEVIADTKAVRKGELVETVTSGATLNLLVGKTTATAVAVTFGATVAT
jgi:hypothetical protein